MRKLESASAQVRVGLVVKRCLSQVGLETSELSQQSDREMGSFRDRAEKKSDIGPTTFIELVGGFAFWPIGTVDEFGHAFFGSSYRCMAFEYGHL